MLTPTCQRWSGGKPSRRPAGETIRTQEYEVCELPGDKIPKAFIQEHHYSGSYPAARFRFGLFHRGQLCGVAVFSHPANQKVLAIFPGEPAESTELGRFVLLDKVPGNGESFFLARCFALLKPKGILGIVSFSDPTPRTNTAGTKVFPGHIGTIYQATNGTYMGRSTPRTLRLLPDGTVLSERSLSKIRSGERGHQYAEELLEKQGATPRGHQPAKDWLDRWIPHLTRKLTHPGNHRYAWILPKKQRNCLPKSQPYPIIHIQ